jgi:hypothetical protein
VNRLSVSFYTKAAFTIYIKGWVGAKLARQTHGNVEWGYVRIKIKINPRLKKEEKNAGRIMNE